MIYARQINPENQTSPLYDDIFPDDIIVDGNRDYYSHTIPAYDHAKNYFDEMANDYEDNKCSIGEILHDYGFTRDDGKPWTNQQKHKWKILMMDDDGIENEAILLSVLELMTGYEWDSRQIHGCCQGEWNNVIYRKDVYDRERLNRFETAYFNTGTEWEVDFESDDPENMNGEYMYCYGMSIDDIRTEIANEANEKPENVVLYTFAGYKKTPIYKVEK